MRMMHNSLSNTARLLYACAILLMTLGHVAAAQQPAPPQASLPTYLSSMMGHTKSGSTKVSAANMLGKVYKSSIEQDFYTTGEVQFTVPDGFMWFQATVGVDDNAQKQDDEVTFEVSGVDANGQQTPLARDTAKALRKPVEVNVSLAGIKILILKATHPNPYHSLWWGDARFVVGGGGAVQGNNGGVANNTMQPVQLVLDGADLRMQIQSLVQHLEADVKKLLGGDKQTDISIALFNLTTPSLDGKILTDIQSSLNDELSKDKSLGITRSKESFSDDLTDFRFGDDLTDKARVAISKRIDDNYLLLGSIADRDTKVVVRAFLYDLHSGKSIAEQKISISIKERRSLILPVPPVKSAITLIFFPESNLQVRTFEWFVDGDSKGTKNQPAGTSTMQALVDPGKHKFKLIWNGAGSRAQGAQKSDYKAVITEEFEIDITKNPNVQLTAHADLLFHKLVLSVRSGDQRISPGWSSP